jgi:hypothetical protein
VSEEPGASRADVLGAAAILAVTAAVLVAPRIVTRLSAHPSAAECEALLDRYAELKARAVAEKLDSKTHTAALDDARRRAGPALAACTSELTLEEADCARRANNADELERCLR